MSSLGWRKRRCKRGHLRSPENLNKKARCIKCLHISDAKSRKKNRDRRRKYNEQWRKQHPGSNQTPERRKWFKQYRSTHLAERRAHEANRRAMLYSAGRWTAKEWCALLNFYGHMCLRCGYSERELINCGLKLVPDHVRPLVKGGRNTIENLQPLCHGQNGCNNVKGTRWVDYRSGNPVEFF